MQPTIAPTTPIPRQETVELVYRIFGDVLVPLEQVRERWFRNLNKENFSKALACGRIAQIGRASCRERVCLYV